jgi:hypothetical protein
MQQAGDCCKLVCDNILKIIRKPDTHRGCKCRKIPTNALLEEGEISVQATPGPSRGKRPSKRTSL